MAGDKSNKTNKLSGEALKQFRHNVSVLKKKGIVSKRVDARSQRATRYMRSKVKKFDDVISGKQIAIRAKPDIRKKYEGILETRGPFIVVPKERARERIKIKRGLVEIEREITGPEGLKYGQEREVILPFKLTDMPALVDRLQTDESLDGLKRGDEMFAFKIDQWASKIGFPDAKEMGDYISRNYAHLFKPKMARQVVKYLTFVRYKASGDQRAKEGKHSYRLSNKPYKGRRMTKADQNMKRKREADRKAAQRSRETPEAHRARLDKQRIRSAQNRQRKMED